MNVSIFNAPKSIVISFIKHVAIRPSSFLKIVIIFVGSVFLGSALPILLVEISQRLQTIALGFEFFSIVPPRGLALLIPAAMAGVTVACLFVEAVCLGYTNSTLYQMIEGGNPSIDNDLFYFFLRG